MIYYNQPKFDALLVEVKQDVLATACGYAVAAWGDSLESFFIKFKESGNMHEFELGNSRYTDGCLGSELVAMTYDRYHSLAKTGEAQS